MIFHPHKLFLAINNPCNKINLYSLKSINYSIKAVELVLVRSKSNVRNPESASRIRADPGNALSRKNAIQFIPIIIDKQSYYVIQKLSSTFWQQTGSHNWLMHVPFDKVLIFYKHILLESVSDNVNVLRELIYCRDGTLNLSNSSFSHYDIEQLIISVL